MSEQRMTLVDHAEKLVAQVRRGIITEAEFEMRMIHVINTWGGPGGTGYGGVHGTE